MNMNDIYEVVCKLIGEIEPVGESHIDQKRFNNIRTMCDIIHKLTYDVSFVAVKRNAQEHSVSKAGTQAYNFLMNLKDDLEEEK